jgi:hypothetical protein
MYGVNNVYWNDAVVPLVLSTTILYSEQADIGLSEFTAGSRGTWEKSHCLPPRHK